MDLEIGKPFMVHFEEEGTYVDYENNEFVFVIKDQFWSDYELDALKKHKLQFDYVDLYDVSLFLLQVEDDIDTSDFVLNIQDYDDIDDFKVKDGYKLSLYLIDQEDIVRGKKEVTLSKEVSMIIYQRLCKQYQNHISEEEFMCNLQGIFSAWEPYELVEKACAHQIF